MTKPKKPRDLAAAMIKHSLETLGYPKWLIEETLVQAIQKGIDMEREDRAAQELFPQPSVEEGSNSVLPFAYPIAHGSFEGGTYEVDGIGYRFSATVKTESGYSIREIIDVQPIISEWITRLTRRALLEEAEKEHSEVEDKEVPSELPDQSEADSPSAESAREEPLAGEESAPPADGDDPVERPRRQRPGVVRGLSLNDAADEE